ncbi:hypothetical protein N9L06_05240 [Mariniblastus sp.]|nr:hypothetical protein [Mariniblastus sp.]
MCSRKFQTSVLILIGMFVISGCGNGVNPKSLIANANDSNVKRLATMYSIFQTHHRFRGPKDEAALKQFIGQQDPKRMQVAGMDISDVDGLFISERDNQPFKIRYGVNTVIRGPAMPVIFEAEGVDGKRQVGFTNGPMQEVDNTDYEKLWNSETKKVKRVEREG